MSDSLAAGKTVQVILITKPPQKLKAFTNCVTVSSSTPDSNSTNNQSCVTVGSNVQSISQTLGDTGFQPTTDQNLVEDAITVDPNTYIFTPLVVIGK